MQRSMMLFTDTHELNKHNPYAAAVRLLWIVWIHELYMNKVAGLNENDKCLTINNKQRTWCYSWNWI